MSTRALPFLLIFSAFLLLGCDSDGSSGPGGSGSDTTGSGSDTTGVVPNCASFRLLNGETSKPAVVKLYFQLKTCDGVPVAGMAPEDFVIKEDGKDVSIYESDQKTITDPKSFKLATVLLVDMSGSILASGSLPSLQQAARAFVSTVGSGQSTAIYTFDGRADLQPLVDFTEDVEALKAGIDSLSAYEVVDKSTNLNGAILNGLGVLDQIKQQHEGAGVLFAGSLAVFTDGTDQAGRVSDGQAVSATQSTEHAVFSIGLGGEVDQGHLSSLGKEGAYFADDVDALESTFVQAATDIEALAKSYYILAYCSPKRAGSHTIELSLVGSNGSLDYPFGADGFEGGCSPDDFLVDPSTCEPNCAGKECGSDGCVGSCGSCGVGMTCVDGTCQEGTTTSDQVWVDSATGYVWQRADAPNNMDWATAKSYCSDNQAGLPGTGWHLPTIGELRSLIRGCPDTMTGGACGVTDDCLSSSCWSGSCEGCSYQDGPAGGCYWDSNLQGDCGWFWSSSPYEDNPGIAWNVYFGYGYVGNDLVNFDRGVRCVRPGP